MSTRPSAQAPAALERRLLKDIKEIQADPYPNIHLHFDDTDIRKACLILTPEDKDALHLTVQFPHDYPLRAPTVQIQSSIIHPNVFGDYICATILNTVEDWTPAYTLKGIVIQLLSFFCSDSLEQDHGLSTVNLAEFRSEVMSMRHWHRPTLHAPKAFTCSTCGFGLDEEEDNFDIQDETSTVSGPKPIRYASPLAGKSRLFSLPDEVVLQLLGEMETQDVLSMAEAIPTVSDMVSSYDFIRIRELQCFCLKTSYKDSKLGIGVAIDGGRRPVLRSEFDLLSQEAFFQHDVRRSIQGVRFDKWLPLPLTHRHWTKVRTNATACLESIHRSANLDRSGSIQTDVLYHFMNNVVVQFSSDFERGFNSSDSRSTLNHASEKAVEAYFGLYHLLLCLATEDNRIVIDARRVISRFITGPRGKSRFPDLGHVLVAALISDDGLTEQLTFLIIKEAILRNVVWMLDTKGAGFAELAYLEPSATSDYRLAMTYHASPTSYRLLMFLKLFSSAARPPNKSLSELRDALFDTHGAPPAGTSAIMAQKIREIHKINDFPGFLVAMGIKDMPSKSTFTSFLRRTIKESVDAGYSQMPMTQSQLYMIRKKRERSVEVAEGIEVTPALERWFERGEKWYKNGWNGRPSFFPQSTRQRSHFDTSGRGHSNRGRARR